MNKSKDQLKYRAYRFSVELIKFATTLPNQQVYRIILHQLIRAATSIGANIIEAQGAASKKDFSNYFHIAFKSANETKYWLCLLRDTTNSDKEKINELLKEADELTKILAASLLTLKGKK